MRDSASTTVGARLRSSARVAIVPCLAVVVMTASASAQDAPPHTSVGSAQRGRLAGGGQELPVTGPGYHFATHRNNPRAHYGTPALVGAIQRAAASVAERWPGSDLAIEDLSVERESPFSVGHGDRAGGLRAPCAVIQLEAMRSGRLHVAGVNTGGNPVAVSCAGFVPFASMSKGGKIVGYEMEIIVPADSSIQSPADLAGKTLAFTSPTSNSGFKAPSALLKTEFGLEADKDFKTTFSGKHDNSILGVANKDYEAAAVANSVLHRMLDRGVVTKDQYRTVYTSQTFPTTGYGHANNLRPEVAAKIKQAFFTFDWSGTSLAEEFGKQADGFVSIHHKSDWDVIRKIDTANGVSYDCK